MNVSTDNFQHDDIGYISSKGVIFSNKNELHLMSGDYYILCDDVESGKEVLNEYLTLKMWECRNEMIKLKHKIIKLKGEK